MTQFFRLAQHFLTLHIRGVRSKSTGDDSNILNIAANYMGFGRNSVLSGAKRSVEDDWLIGFASMEPSSSDETNRETFRTQLKALRSNLLKEIDGHSADNVGNTESAIREALQIVNDIWQICDTLELTDAPYKDDDPLAIFEYEAAYYLCLRRNSGDSLTGKKRDAIIKRLNAVRGTVESIRESKPAADCSEQVTGAIDLVIADNIRECEAATKKVAPSVSLSFFATLSLPLAVKPKEGELGEAMARAKKAIHALKAEEQQSEAVSQDPVVAQLRV